MDLTNYVYKKEKELGSSSKGLSTTKLIGLISSQILLPFTKLDRMVLASNFADVDWEKKKVLTLMTLGKYAAYGYGAYKLIS